MKVIDLLNKIAKGEEVPKKIKCKCYVYWYCNDLKDYENAQVEYKDYLFASKYHSPNWLDYEVEIIEEDKEIKKIEVYEDSDGNYFYDKHCHKIYITCDEINFMFEQFNELIDEINELKKGD